MFIGVLPLMFVVMFALKLVGYVTFSWWVVTAPLWAPIFIAVVWLIFLFIFTLFLQ